VENALADYCRAHVVQTEADCAALGDEVTLDFEGFVDGVAFEGGKGESFPLVLGSGMFIPGFEEQVVGICVGEERDVHVTFPQAYVPELAGKQALFKIKAHKITRRQMPELTEEFAAAQGFESLSALRCQVMETALQAKQNQALDTFTQNLLDQVMANMTVTVPESMVESQLQGLMEELERTVMSQGMQLKDYLEAAQLTLEDLRAHARANAEMAARYELAMMEIARLENITVTEEEVQAKYAELSDMYGMSLQQIRAQLPPSRLSHDIKLLRARAVVVDSAKRI
jgi:trigger factor